MVLSVHLTGSASVSQANIMADWAELDCLYREPFTMLTESWLQSEFHLIFKPPNI